jgi:hypothetical protein
MTSSGERVIPHSAWSAVCDPDVEATASAFAFDVNPERSHAALVAVGEGPIVEVTDYRPGVAWLVDRIVELWAKYRVPFAVDAKGPGASFVDELTRRGVRLFPIEQRDLPAACAGFYDAVLEGSLKVRANADLDAAVAVVVKRSVGDAWVWGRRPSRADISLLMAATLGLDQLRNRRVREPSITLL